MSVLNKIITISLGIVVMLAAAVVAVLAVIPLLIGALWDNGEEYD